MSHSNFYKARWRKCLIKSSGRSCVRRVPFVTYCYVRSASREATLSTVIITAHAYNYQMINACAHCQLKMLIKYIIGKKALWNKGVWVDSYSLRGKRGTFIEWKRRQKKACWYRTFFYSIVLMFVLYNIMSNPYLYSLSHSWQKTTGCCKKYILLL